MRDDYNKDRLGKIIELAKRGVGGEQKNALQMVKSICKKHGLDFDEVMGEGDQIREYAFPWKKKKYKELVCQIVCAYAVLESHQNMMENKIRKMLFVQTTQAKYFETLNAIDVLIRLYDKEQKKMKLAFFYGFLEKHDLWNRFPQKKNKKETEEEMRARMTGSRLAEGMEDAKIHKQLNGKN